MTRQADTREISSRRRSGARRWGTPESGPLESGTLESDPLESGTPESGPPESGPTASVPACEPWPKSSAVAEQTGPTVHALFRLSRMNKTMIGGRLRKFGLAAGQELLLLQLWDRDGCSQSDLVDRLGIDPSTVTKMLQRLERGGWVRRAPLARDRRVTIVSLTAAGRRLQGDVTQLWAELERETIRGLSGDERATLLGLLHKVEGTLHATGATECEVPAPADDGPCL